MERSPILIDVLLAGVYRELATDGVVRIQGDLDLRDPAVALERRHFVRLMSDDVALQAGIANAFEGEERGNG